MVDARQLEDVQVALLNLFGHRCDGDLPPDPDIKAHKERMAIRECLGLALEHLIMDLGTHVQMLGVPAS